ncbi:MAG: hypothetical protein IKG25_05665 [Mogibacterium sp.]|nr:hypothetical protein [Mogibacterium sp.]MBR4090059.1 hypothetical protein [Mogibacterium sp.]
MWGVFTDVTDGLRVSLDLDRIVSIAELPDATTYIQVETNSKNESINVKESFDEVMKMIAANEVQI